MFTITAIKIEVRRTIFHILDFTQNIVCERQLTFPLKHLLELINIPISGGGLGQNIRIPLWLSPHGLEDFPDYLAKAS